MHPDCDLRRTRLMLYPLRTLNKHVKLTKQWWTTVNTTIVKESLNNWRNLSVFRSFVRKLTNILNYTAQNVLIFLILQGCSLLNSFPPQKDDSRTRWFDTRSFGESLLLNWSRSRSSFSLLLLHSKL